MKNCKSENALGQGLRRRANIQLERTQDGLRARLQGADGQQAAGHDKECNQQNQGAHGRSHKAREADRSGRSGSIQLYRGLRFKAAETAEVGGLDSGGQQNTDQTQDGKAGEPLRRSVSVVEAQCSRCHFPVGCGQATSQVVPGQPISLILALPRFGSRYQTIGGPATIQK